MQVHYRADEIERYVLITTQVDSSPLLVMTIPSQVHRRIQGSLESLESLESQEYQRF